MSTGASGQGAESLALRKPEQLGKYELICHLATGGMAEIHLARASGIEGFQKIVVLKRILPALAANPEIVSLFLDEARLAATLQHSNIVQVYDVGIVDGSYFFTMEFVHGEDVRMLLRTVTDRHIEIPLDVSLSIVLGIAAGLHYAHEKVGFDGKPLGIIHRDVSPSNVLVSYEGLVKVVDFGIAKAASRSAETQHGSVRGKFGYMSPEQCQSRNLDRRSDVFAIAIVLYELTTHTKLFKGESDYDIMKAIVEHDAPMPSTRKPGYPPELERIVMKGLSRNPDDRYPNAEELQLDLENFAREQKLRISTVTVARFMEQLFGKKIEEWRMAQQRGTELFEHVAQTVTAGTPSYSSQGIDVDLGTMPGRAVERPKPEPSPAPKVAPPAVVPRRGKGVFIAIGAVAAAVLAGAIVIGTRTPPPPPVPPNVEKPVPETPKPIVETPKPIVEAPKALDAGPNVAATVKLPPIEHSKKPKHSIAAAPSTEKPEVAPTPVTPKPKPKQEWDPDSPVPP
jgi:serine/threonine protein kinase